MSVSSRVNATISCLLFMSISVLTMWALAAQDEQKLTPRQLFYTRKPTNTKRNPVKPPDQKKKPDNPDPVQPGNDTAKTVPSKDVIVPYLGLRYSILQENAGGSMAEVDPEKVFHSGDKIHLKLQVNDAAYLYLLAEGSKGNWKVLFPSPEIQEGDNRLQPGTEVTIPGTAAFRFDDDPGTEKIYVVLSKQPETDLDYLLYTTSKNRGQSSQESAGNKGTRRPLSAAIPDSDVARLGGNLKSRGFDIVASKQIEKDKENAVYLVSPRPDAKTSRLTAQIVFKHE